MKKREFSFMYKPQYKAAVKMLQKGLKQMSQLVEYDSKEKRIQETKSEICNAVKNQLIQFVSEEKKRIAEQKLSIEKSYARSRSVYENPTEELLRRQDFDMEVATMDENEIMAFLKTPGRTFTSYELNKIYSLDVKNTEIKARVKHAINENRYPYLKDIKYQKLVKQENDLALIDDKSAQNTLLYLPANTPQGYTTLGLTSVFMNLDKHEMSKKVSILDDSLAIKPSDEIETFATGLRKSIKEESISEKPKRVYNDFDSRIFRGSSDFDIADRFKYLEERFDDKSTDRFNKIKENYSVMDHMDFLEGQHAKKIASDSKYREAYQNAEKELSGQRSNAEEVGEAENE